MIYLQTFEEEQYKLPKIEDYVYLDCDSYNNILRKFLINRIGKVVNITDNATPALKRYYIQFDEPNPWDFSKYMSVDIIHIEYWSPDKDDVERYIQMKNYNL